MAILLGFDIAQRLARLFGQRPQEHVGGALQVARVHAFRLCDTRLDESWRLLAHNMMPVPWGVRVRVAIGEPIARGAGEDRDALVGRVRNEIGAMLERWRSGHARGST